ncbi:MAG: hypothetical protein GY863_10130 [bacterium]|nr:hypothetical protein [bacterium]
MNNEMYIKTGRPEFDNFFPMIRSFLEHDIMDIVIDAKEIRGYRTPDAKSIWIRDHSDMMRGFKYFEKEMKSTVEHFAETQADNGRIFDYFTVFPEKLPSERENWTKYVRVPVEADVEFKFVKAAFQTWQVTGDDDWIRKLLPKLEKALDYILTNPWRWDEKYGLVKRAYTIDTWDFAYTAGKHDWLQFQINDDTFWGFMHGDNSGYYEAFNIMALFFTYFGEIGKAEKWERRAVDIRKAMNEICWNGNFYTHFVKLTPVEIEGVDEANQLSLSNPMDINRGAATQEMAAAIIKEYRKRKEETGAFAEWFSIDPPFPDGIFGDEKLVGGAYVNGGIMPLVGGELAKAALDNGFEEYGVDILNRYYKMISEKGETYLWYFPDGTPASVETSTSPDAQPTDGWGSSAMAYALVEGLAGVEDKFKLFRKVKLSPRWLAAGVREAEVQVRYNASDTPFKYNFSVTEEEIDLNIKCRESHIHFHVLLPEGTRAQYVMVGEKYLEYSNLTVEKSRYVDFELNVKNFENIKVLFKKDQ